MATSAGNRRPDDLFGFCLVNAAAGTIASRSSTILSLVHTGPGVFEILLGGGGVAITEMAWHAQAICASSNDISVNVEVVSRVLLRIRTSSSGTPFDIDFSLDIGRRVTDATGGYVASPLPPPPPAGGGDVVGTPPSTDNAIARYDGVTGLLIQNSSVILDDFGTMTVPAGQGVEADLGRLFLGSLTTSDVWIGSFGMPQIRLQADQALGEAGVAAAPFYSFDADGATGIFNPAPGVLAVAGAGVEQTRWSSAQQLSPLGAVGAPSYSFAGDTNTGIFSSAADTVNVAAAGVEQTRWSGAQQLSPAGSAAAPSYAFLTSATAGLYLAGITSPAIASAGVEAMRWVGAQTRAQPGTAALPGISFSGDISTGVFDVAAANAVGISSSGTEVTRFAAGQQQSVLGAVGAPSYSFAGDLNTGAYSPGADIYAVTANGVEQARWTGSQQLSPLGAVGSPSYSFIGDANTGIFSSAADTVNVAANGVEQTRWSGAQQLSPLGAVGAPSYSFAGDTNTGIFSSAADTVNVAAGGVEQARWTGSQQLAPDGTAALPAYSFAADTNTGVYRAGADQVGVSAGGSVRANITSTAFAATVQFQAIAGTAGIPSYSTVGDTNTGIFFSAADTLDVTTGGTSRARWGSTGSLAHDFALLFSGSITPAQITADQNDYAPASFANAFAVFQDVDAATRSITGLAGGASGRFVAIFNIATGAANIIRLTNEDAASTAANRFILPDGANLDIGPGSCALLLYQAGAVNRWRVVAVC